MPAADTERSPLCGVETVWHTPQWAAALESVFGFEDCTLRDADGCLPLFLTRSPWMGTKLVSAVFNGYASPLAPGEAAEARLVARAVALARERRVDWLEIKGVAPLPGALLAEQGLEVRRPYWLDALSLADGASPDEALSPAFRKHLRRMQRRASDAGVRIEASVAGADLDAFHDVLVRRNRDRFATLAQPRSLLREIGRRFFEADSGRLFVARSSSGAVLGGALFLEHAGCASGFLSAAEEGSRSLSLDTLVKHAALRHYAASGVRCLDFGLTSPSQPSVLEAKGRFGTTRTRSFRILLPVGVSEIPEPDYATQWPRIRALYRWLPMPLARTLPEWLARQLN